MQIPEIYARRKPAFSFEFFPTKTDQAEESLFAETVPALKALDPAFISVTYGAGGGTRDRTLRMVDRLRRDSGIEAMAHLTCVGSTVEMLGSFLDAARDLGIENILALRGDPPRGQTTFAPVPGGFAHASELIRLVRGRNCFAVGAAGYPEGHQECPDKFVDWDRTGDKVAAGADFIITQLFYDARDYIAFREYLQVRRGVKVPIVPGIMPFLNAEQIKRIMALCGARMPPGLQQRLDAVGHDDALVHQLGVEVCADLCRTLLAAGAPGIHFYCLNRATACREIMARL